jgi:hypothetical protein
MHANSAFCKSNPVTSSNTTLSICFFGSVKSEFQL